MQHYSIHLSHFGKISRLGPILTLLMILLASARGNCDAYREYIERYSPLAVEQQEKYGIPASITLAQGLLESGAGRSTLAKEGNNHFGIKCHRDWTGETMLRDDDAPDECFRVYSDVAESFRDHSLFLKRKRYSSLFDLDITDYSSWARGLRECGYATDPNYADRLITIIERYALYCFDSGGGEREEEIAGFILDHLRTSHIIRKSRGLHYIIAVPGDTYGKIAGEFKISLNDILSYNDMEKDGEIKEWEEVYLQPKHDESPGGLKQATIGDGESLHSLAQRYGVKQHTLERLNPGIKDRAGERIRMR